MTHRLNGDDIMRAGYDMSAAAANNQAGTLIPLAAPAAGEAAAPTILRVRFYHYQ
jgi:hypothetical protein